MRRRFFLLALFFAISFGSETRGVSLVTDTTKADTSKVKKKEPERALPLKPERKIEFATNEATWLALDVSPDGKMIVFELLGDLYTLPISGGKATRMTSGLAFDTQPRYSPDGRRLVFISDRSGSENLWLLETGRTIADTTATADSTGLKQLTKGPGGTYASPEWAPDGKYIIASKGTTSLGVYHLWMYHVEGGSGVDLLAKEKDRNAMGAAFGPEGRYIYFATKMGRWGYNLPGMSFQVAIYDREVGKVFPLTGEVGGKVGIGSHGQLQGLGYHWELWAVQSGGMSNLDALRCATIFGAQAIGFEKDLGSLAPGKLADLLVLDRNPLENIRNTTSIRYVMKNGLMYNAETLDQIWPMEKKLGNQYWWNQEPR